MATSPIIVSDVPLLANWIAGEWESGASGAIPTTSPTRPSEIVALVPSSDCASVDKACGAASAAFSSWSKLAGPARAEHLHKWSEAIKTRASELAIAIVREVGKPIGEARGEVARCEMILRYYAGEAVREEGQVIPAQTAGSLQFSLRQPVGPIGLITPWNFPLAIPLWKAAPALAFGNTVVLKPAEASSYVGYLLAQTAHEAGLPAGIFNVLLGKGSEIGPALVRHEGICAVSFTGSDAVGSKIAEACAKRNIKCQTEMGGKNVAIVAEDADLVQAATLTAGGAMRFAGQKCTATSRAVVQRSVLPKFLDELIIAIDQLPYGDPAEVPTAIGPVISSEAKREIFQAIQDASAERIYGEKGVSSELAEGYFVSPTVFVDVQAGSDLAQEELFGPVLAVIHADDFDHAIELANNSKFGLSASLFTKNLPRALDYVKRIEAGMVRVNGDTTGVDPHAPFGGMKSSSSHSREQGPAAKEFFTELKTVQINP